MAEHLITALTLRGGTVGWTSLREKKKKGEFEIAEQCDAPLGLPENVTDMSSAEAVAALKSKCSVVKGRLSLGMPTDQVLMRVVQLPATDLAELRSMADLQVDKFSPFPIEQMSIGMEILAQTEGQSRVLIAAAQIERVEKLGTMMTQAGLSPRSVDIEVMGWWWLLNQSNLVPEKGRHALLVLDENCSELIVVQDRIPVVFRSLGSHAAMSPIESATDIADEINYTLTTIESDWGALNAGPLLVWHADSSSQEFINALRERCDLGVSAHNLESLHPLHEGLAFRAAARSESMLDLAPAQWNVDVQSRSTRKAALVAGGTVLGVWLLLMAIFLVVWEIQQVRLNRIKSEAARLAGPSKEVKQFQEQVKSLEKYGDRTYSSIECLREVCERLPEGIDITSFSYKKYTEVSLRGEADQSDPIYDLIKQLEESKMFTNVAPGGVTDEMRGGRRRSQFRVTCSLQGEQP